MMNKFMQIAIKEALKTEADVPVGAVLVKNDEIIAKSHNTKELDNDVTSHAEILAIRQGEKFFNNWRLDGCELYVTLEPCPMCGWAILQSRISKVYYGSYDTKYGAFSALELHKKSEFKPQIYGGILEKECDEVLKTFFEKIR